MKKSVDEIMGSYTPEVGDVIKRRNISGEEMTCLVTMNNGRHVVYVCNGKEYTDTVQDFVRRVKRTVRNGASFFRGKNAS
jgi:hypothetical protein